MYAHLFSVRFIQDNLFKITTELLLIMMDRKSYMRYHLVPLSLTLSDLERLDRKSYMRFHLAPLCRSKESV